jgi:two-component system sensor histidine kinase BaeS
VFGRSLGPLGLRFAAAFVGVALFAVVVFSVAVLIADQGNVAHLAATQRDRTAAEIVALVENAYDSGSGWPRADLRPVTAFAAEAGVGVEIRDQNHAVRLAHPAPGPAGSTNPLAVRRPITANGRTVGQVTIDFESGGVGPGDNHLRSSLFAAVAWSAGLAALAAIMVGLLVTRGVIRPVRRLASVVKALKLGQSSPRVGPNFGPGELGELGQSFNAMADSLEEEDRLRRALVADVAHELRTPISVMQAETEALSDGITAPSREALSSLHEEAERLGRLVEDLQTLASAQASGLELSRRPLDLGRVAADGTASLGSQFRNAGIHVRQDLPPTGTIGDARRLHQVAVNLLSNALKFTPPGGTVTVRTFMEDSEAVLEVSDSGPGIAEGEQDAIWERFYRGSASRDQAGSGIGLAVVKELVDAHGGTITVDSRAGHGASFVVRLPGTPAQLPEAKVRR